MRAILQEAVGFYKEIIGEMKPIKKYGILLGSMAFVTFAVFVCGGF